MAVVAVEVFEPKWTTPQIYLGFGLIFFKEIYDSTSSVYTELDRRAEGMVLTPSVTYCAVC